MPKPTSVDSLFYALVDDVPRLERYQLDFLSSYIADVTMELDEVHGVTRERVGRILDVIGSGELVSEEDLAEAPSLYDEARNYLQRHGVVDRFTFEKVMFGFDRSAGSANWYVDGGVRGLFPRILVEIVLGRKVGKNVVEADVVQAGDKLYGVLDKTPFESELRGILADHGVMSAEMVRNLNQSEIKAIAEQSTAGSTTILSRVLFGKRPKGLDCSLAQALANWFG